MTLKERDISHLNECLSLARQAQQKNEVPVGALVADSLTGRVVAKAYNLKENLNSPIAHAEVLAVHRACKKLKTWRLTGYTLYSSLEPCVMCSGVVIQARLDRVVWAASDSKGGGHSLFGLLGSDLLNHKTERHQGLLAQESSALLRDFFKRKR